MSFRLRSNCSFLSSYKFTSFKKYIYVKLNVAAFYGNKTTECHTLSETEMICNLVGIIIVEKIPYGGRLCCIPHKHSLELESVSVLCDVVCCFSMLLEIHILQE